MKKIIPLLALVLIISCDGVRERRETEIYSIYLNKEFTSFIPLVYLKNLPHVKDVSKYVANNSPTLIAKVAKFKITELENHSIGSLSPDRLVTPIRLKFISIGTKFKVVDEYISFRHTPLGPSKIPMLVLKDEYENISEISQSSFEFKFIDVQKRNSFVKASAKESMRMLYKFKDRASVTINYCPKNNITKNQNVNKFFHDFHLENDIKVHEKKPSCKNGTTITFFNPESLLTARYYFEEWSLYGQWCLLPKIL